MHLELDNFRKSLSKQSIYRKLRIAFARFQTWKVNDRITSMTSRVIVIITIIINYHNYRDHYK